jgi:hypothetical protein
MLEKATKTTMRQELIICPSARVPGKMLNTPGDECKQGSVAHLVGKRWNW